jgi:hypothetical protein
MIQLVIMWARDDDDMPFDLLLSICTGILVVYYHSFSQYSCCHYEDWGLLVTMLAIVSLWTPYSTVALYLIMGIPFLYIYQRWGQLAPY